MYDTDATTSSAAGPISTADSPVSGTLTPPATQASAPPVLTSSQPSQAPSATSPNRRLHNFVGSVLGAIAGPPPTQYTTDQNGRLTPLASPPETTSEKVKRITSNAIGGLGAGAAAPPQKSGLASALAGFGAGAAAVSGKRSADENLSKEEARKNFEEQQRATLQKYEVAKINAQNFQLHFQNVKMQNDLDPVRAQNKEIADAFKNIPGHSVQEMPAEAARAAISDPNNPVWAHTHLVLAGGLRPVTDADGSPVKNADGTFKTEGWVHVIDGMAKDGKVPLPASVLSDIKKYSSVGQLAAASGLDRLKEGQELEPQQFLRLYSSLLASKVEVEKGWVSPDLVEDKSGSILQRNLTTGETKPATEAQTQKFQTDKANLAEKQQQVKTGRSTEVKNYAEAEKAREDAKRNQAASPTDQALVKQIGEGRSDLPNPRTKEGQRIAALVAEAYPDYDVTKGMTWSKSRNEYMGSGQTAKKAVAYNTALAHMKDLYDHSTFEGIYVPGSKDYSDRSVALNYVANEVGNAIKTGVMTEKEGKEILDSLKGWTPGTAKERVSETARLLHDKIDEYQRKFDESKPSSAVQVPILMSPKAGSAYDYVQSGGKLQPKQPPSGQPNPPNPDATHIVPGPDGKLHYTNDSGTVDYGVAQ